MRTVPSLIVLVSLVAAFGVARLHASGPARLTQPRPQLEMPLKCDIGRDCIVQKLFDHDPGPGRADYMCGTLTTDGHNGIDFRIIDPEKYQQGVTVAAAAGGIVLRTRDGEPDESIKERGTTGGRDAGNGVVIDHGGGWVSQYSHMRKDSIRVHPGDRVSAGQLLGFVGLSGNTEYPHLHFTIRHLEVPVDPFQPDIDSADCRETSRRSTLWKPVAARSLAYQPTALVGVGMTSSLGNAGRADLRDRANLSGHRSDTLLLWVQIAGVEAGDVVHFRITGADGSIVVDLQTAIDKGALIWTGYSGRKPPLGGWPTGQYRGFIALDRGHERTLSAQSSITVQ